jgi:hypothetical protein
VIFTSGNDRAITIITNMCHSAGAPSPRGQLRCPDTHLTIGCGVAAKESAEGIGSYEQTDQRDTTGEWGDTVDLSDTLTRARLTTLPIGLANIAYAIPNQPLQRGFSVSSDGSKASTRGGRQQ